MRVAASVLTGILACAAAACGQPSQQPPDNEVANAPTEIETLPADESTTTPSDQLQSGVDSPDVNGVTTNSD